MSGTLVAARALEWTAGGRRILGPLDLEVRRGECVAVVGPNGAGKTTLLRLVTGVLAPSHGRLELAGRPFAGLARREIARRIAYVPQIRPLRVPLTVERLVLLGRYPHLTRSRVAPTASDFEVARRAMDDVGVAGLAERPVDELSGGERQAAYIAAALAQEGELLVLDEPTTHLDPSHQQEIAALVRRLGAEVGKPGDSGDPGDSAASGDARQGGRTVLLATHDLNFASLVADRILALREGRILASGPPARLLRPELLGELFGAPFEIVRGGERPVTVLDLHR